MNTPTTNRVSPGFGRHPEDVPDPSGRGGQDGTDSVWRYAGRGLLLRPFDDPRRGADHALGITNSGPRQVLGLSVDDARRHLYVIGLTGAGKTVWEMLYALAEINAGRGVAVIDLQGDLATMLLDRIPIEAADRLVIIDPAERGAPPSFNPLSALAAGARPSTTPHHGSAGDVGDGTSDRAREAAEWAADTLTAVFASLYRQWWGPRMDELMRSACLTVTADPDATLLDVLRLLTNAGFRRHFLTAHPPSELVATLWTEFEQLSALQRTNLVAPLASRLRAVLGRSFAAALLTAPKSSFSLTDILDGGILIARLPKGELGADAARLIGSMLVSGLWAHTTRRSLRAPEDRPDATIIIDEAQNLLHLPVGVDEALAESRGFRVSWLLAHQNLAQLRDQVREAIDANARTKILFTVSPADAARLVAHVRPYFTEHDLANRPARQMTVRSVHHGHPQPAYTLDSPPLPPPVPGRAALLRERARRRTGIETHQRTDDTKTQTNHRKTRGSKLRHPGGEQPRAVAKPTAQASRSP